MQPDTWKTQCLSLREEVGVLTARVAALETENQQLKDKNQHLYRQLFGRSSEALDPRQLEFLMAGMPVVEPGPELTPAPAVRPRQRKRRKYKPRMPENMLTEDIVIEPEAVKKAPGDFRLIGEEITYEMDCTLPVYFRRRYIRRKYVSILEKAQPPIVGALPPRLIEGGYAGPGLLTDIILKKYVDHLPLYRQEKILKTRFDIDLSRQTMCDWVGRIADWCKPIYRHIRDELRKAGYLQIDETPVAYVRGDGGGGKKGYFWVYNRPGGGVYFEWHTGRGVDCLEDVLKTFVGKIQADGYGVYPSYVNRRNQEAGKTVIELAGCMAHVRRKFYEARQEAPCFGGWVLNQIAHLYQIEKCLRAEKAGPALRAAVRAGASGMILARLHRALVLKEKAYLPKSGLGTAIAYTLERWTELTLFRDDGRLEIDNNGVENAIRPTALGKKNWLFIGHPEAGERSAILYTLLENCRKLGINPQEYLHDILTRLPSTPIPETIHLTPANWLAARKARAA